MEKAGSLLLLQMPASRLLASMILAGELTVDSGSRKLTRVKMVGILLLLIRRDGWVSHSCIDGTGLKVSSRQQEALVQLGW